MALERKAPQSHPGDPRRLGNKRQRSADPQAPPTKPVQNCKDIMAHLGMDERVKPTTLVNLQDALRKRLADQAQKANPECNGEKVFAYKALGT